MRTKHPESGPQGHASFWAADPCPPGVPAAGCFGRAQAAVWFSGSRRGSFREVISSCAVSGVGNILRVWCQESDAAHPGRSTSAVIPRPGHAVACFHTRGCRAEESTVGLLEGRRGSPCLLRGYDTGGQGQCRSGATGHQQQTVDFSVGAQDFVRADGAVWRLLRNDIRARASLRDTLHVRENASAPDERYGGAFRSHSGGGIRTRDLRVMSPTSYQAAPPRDQDTTESCVRSQIRRYRWVTSPRFRGVSQDSTSPARSVPGFKTIGSNRKLSAMSRCSQSIPIISGCQPHTKKAKSGASVSRARHGPCAILQHTARHTIQAGCGHHEQQRSAGPAAPAPTGPTRPETPFCAAHRLRAPRRAAARPRPLPAIRPRPRATTHAARIRSRPNRPRRKPPSRHRKRARSVPVGDVARKLLLRVERQKSPVLLDPRRIQMHA